MHDALCSYCWARLARGTRNPAIMLVAAAAPCQRGLIIGRLSPPLRRVPEGVLPDSHRLRGDGLHRLLRQATLHRASPAASLLHLLSVVPLVSAGQGIGPNILRPQSSVVPARGYCRLKACLPRPGQHTTQRRLPMHLLVSAVIVVCCWLLYVSLSIACTGDLLLLQQGRFPDMDTFCCLFAAHQPDHRRRVNGAAATSSAGAGVGWGAFYSFSLEWHWNRDMRTSMLAGALPSHAVASAAGLLAAEELAMTTNRLAAVPRARIDVMRTESW